MKLIFYFLFLFSITNFFSQSKDNNAHKEIERHLKIIGDFVKDNFSDSTLRRVASVYFMERVSKIYSESDANDIGKLNPTRADYDKWSDWYEKNKTKLYWNKRKNKVVFKQ